jgi:DNA polymerase (family 10)
MTKKEEDMDQADLIHILNEIGLLLEIKGENPFKSRAYYQAARTLENLNPDLKQLVKEARLGELPGFGAALAAKVAEWCRTGTIRYYEELKAGLPPGLLELLQVPGLGAKKINVLYTKLAIVGLEQLAEACEQNQLVDLPGFGAKTQAKIAAGIRFIREHRGQYLRSALIATAEQLRERLAGHPKVGQVAITGSLRRRLEVVKDIDLVAASTAPEEVIRFWVESPQVAEVIASGPAKASVTLKLGANAALRVVRPEEYPHALQYFTGSKEHNMALRRYAKKLGFKINEYGLFCGENPLYCRDEAAIYQTLKLAYVPPELREDRGEFDAAAADRLPELVRANDLKGLFHVHTTYSDGVNTLREMVEAAIALGYSYLGIADHSRTAVYAHGLDETALARQFDEIDALNHEYPGFTIFKGIESDILPDGELDYPPEILARFDFVIGSVHSRFRMGGEMMTKRILTALDNPFLTMLGHPTGRLLLQRPAYELDLEAVIAKAAQKRIVIEFNANPYRYDLDWRWCRRAKAAGVLIAVNPDAHSIRELQLARSGVAVAAKGWLERDDILNTRDPAALRTLSEGRFFRQQSR